MMMIYKDLKKSLIDLEVIIPSLDNAIRNINESHSRSIANPNSVFHNFSVEKLEIAKRNMLPRLIIILNLSLSIRATKITKQKCK